VQSKTGAAANSKVLTIHANQKESTIVYVSRREHRIHTNQAIERLTIKQETKAKAKHTYKKSNEVIVYSFVTTNIRFT
jgi:hypothetical protein